MSIYRVFLFTAQFLGLIWLPATLAVADRPLTPQDWQLIRKEKDFILFQKEVPGTSVVAFRGEGLIEAPLWKVASILLDDRRAPEWVDRLIKSKIIGPASPYEFLDYTHFKTLPFVKEREFVARVKLEVDEKAKTFTIRQNSVEFDLPSKPNLIRGDLIYCLFNLSSGPRESVTRLTVEIQADPKGSIPKWLVNTFQQNWPIVTFRGIQKQVEKSNIEAPHQFQAVLVQLRKF